MAKDISANAELTGGKIEAALSLSNNKLTTDADIHGLIPIKGSGEGGADGFSPIATVEQT